MNIHHKYDYVIDLQKIITYKKNSKYKRTVCESKRQTYLQKIDSMENNV